MRWLFNKFNKVQIRVICVWAGIFITLYFIVRGAPSGALDHRTVTATPPDAVAFIAMGAIASDPMVDYSIESIRTLGRYEGDIYVVTDKPACFSGESSIRNNVKVVTINSVNSIIEMKALKPKLLTLLPTTVENILYLDVDIVVTKDITTFIADYSIVRDHYLSTHDAPPQNRTIVGDMYDFGLFYDAAGHYVGFCSGCEKWHTGVLMLKRGHGTTCLESWGKILLSGQFTTDQESLDEAERIGDCTRLIGMGQRHLLFAKDYIAWVLTSGHTFIHLTAAARITDQDYFYREVVVPRIRSALNLPLAIERKNCN